MRIWPLGLTFGLIVWLRDYESDGMFLISPWVLWSFTIVLSIPLSIVGLGDQVLYGHFIRGCQ